MIQFNHYLIHDTKGSLLVKYKITPHLQDFLIWTLSFISHGWYVICILTTLTPTWLLYRRKRTMHIRRSNCHARWRHMAKGHEIRNGLDTWELVPLPVDRKPLPCKWVFRYKCVFGTDKPKYKARLIAKGFKQEQGVDLWQDWFSISQDDHPLAPTRNRRD
mgnify:FL=1